MLSQTQLQVKSHACGKTSNPLSLLERKITELIQKNNAKFERLADFHSSDEADLDLHWMNIYYVITLGCIIQIYYSDFLCKFV